VPQDGLLSCLQSLDSGMGLRMLWTVTEQVGWLGHFSF